MNRRNVLMGLGGLVAGGGALLGTGAFTTVEADRTVTVNAAGDASALLALAQAGNGTASDVVNTQNGLLVINFGAAGTADGVNLDALTTVGEVSDTTDDGAFDTVVTPALTITNNGTQTVDVDFNIGFNSGQTNLPTGTVPGDVLKLWTDAGGTESINSGDFGNLVENTLSGLESGNSVNVALQIDTVGLDTQDIVTTSALFESEATIIASAL